MKKLIFYVSSLKPSGGIERVISNITSKLANDFEITILTKDSGESFYSIDSRVHIDSLNSSHKLNMNNRIFRMFQVFGNLLKNSSSLYFSLRKKDFDYIYITHPIERLELFFAGVDKEKIVISEHGASNNYNFFYRIIRIMLYKKCRSYCIPTRYDYDFYSHKGYPVIYTPHYKSNLIYKKSSFDKIVLSIGRFTEDKKQLSLLKIWKEISPLIGSEWKLYLVGDGELKNELKCFIESENLQDSVLLISPSRDIEYYYSKASIFALTSRSEGFGMVLLEAIGFSVPIISFDCPSGPRDIIKDQKNGYLIGYEDNDSYKEKLIAMIEDKSLLEKLSLGAKYTFDNWSDNSITSIWCRVFK